MGGGHPESAGFYEPVGRFAPGGWPVEAIRICWEAGSVLRKRWGRRGDEFPNEISLEPALKKGAARWGEQGTRGVVVGQNIELSGVRDAFMVDRAEMIVIDGSAGEGGGQILRSSLTLAMVTGKGFRIEKIRARRPKPGLARQHLVAVEAAAAICRADVQGASLGSTELLFQPKEVVPGKYAFDIGTAGSTSLVVQTLLPAMILQPGRWELELVGGTHNPLAPPVEFLQMSYLPLLRQMGAEVELQLHRPGFYPAGGGKVTVRVVGKRQLNSLELLERGPLRRRHAWAVVANLPLHIAEREVDTLRRLLGLRSEETAVSSWNARGPGNVVAVELHYENITEVFAGFGERGKPAEKVAEELAQQVQQYLASDAPVGPHLADQILIPLALAGKGRFRTLPLTSHAETNIATIGYFLDIRCHVTPEGENACLVEVFRGATTPSLNENPRSPGALGDAE